METSRVFWKVLPFLDFWILLFAFLFFSLLGLTLGPKIGLTNCGCAIRERTARRLTALPSLGIAVDCGAVRLGSGDYFGAVFLGLLIKDCYERFTRGLLVRDCYEQSALGLLIEVCYEQSIGACYEVVFLVTSISSPLWDN
ncbi:hypothetical protein PanWU01x14_313090 [Parasponia andersonii]|uniref:Transmembrane protein n=1 Tax=Parasponia andersonii TaxID=3476 RepID=A0A2P5AP97_PARAD|nr:hypothetical protein PanWU01x14_313090 [Parasponia andersonii]